jgi:hypothetical protein
MRYSLRLSTGLLVLVLAVTLCSRASASLQSFWNFDDGATATDQVGSNHGIAFQGGAGFAADTHNVGGGGGDYSLDLTHGDDYVTLAGTDYSITNAYTISAWVKRNGTGSGRFFSIKRDLTGGGGDRAGVNLGVSGSNVYSGVIINPDPPSGNDANNGADTFHDYRTTAASVPPIGEDTWTHVAATLANDKITMYVNGVAETTYNLGSGTGYEETEAGHLKRSGRDVDFNDPNGSFSGFGADGSSGGDLPDYTTQYFDGRVDEVAVWNSRLWPSQIQELAAGVAPTGVQPGLSVGLDNPGFEDDSDGETGTDISGWTVAPNEFFITQGAPALYQPYDPDVPAEGDLFLTANRLAGGADSNPASSTATQTVDLSAHAQSIDTGQSGIELGFQYYISTGENEAVSLSFLDGTGGLLEDLVASNTGTPDELLLDTYGPTEWKSAVLDGLIPVGTRSIEIEVTASRPGGSVTNAGFDDFSGTLYLMPIPEPSTLLLAALGLLGLTFWRCRGSR